MTDNNSMNLSGTKEVEDKTVPSSVTTGPMYGGDHLRCEMTAFNAALHYAEKISPGVTTRLSAADFAAVHQGTIRSLSGLMAGGKPLFGAGSLPELRIGPVTSVLNTVVQSAVNLTTAASRLYNPPQGDRRQMVPVLDKERKSGQKRVDSNKGQQSKKTYASALKTGLEKDAKAKNTSKPSKAAPSSVPPPDNITKQSRRSKKKEEKLKKRLELPLDFGQDLDKDKLLTPEQRAAMKEARLTGSKKMDPKVQSGTTGKNIVGSVQKQKQSKVLDVKSKMADNLFRKVKRSYSTPTWMKLCNLIKVTLEDLQRKCYSYSESELCDINILRANGVPPIVAIGYFQPDVVSSLDWTEQMELKDQLDKACRSLTRCRSNSVAKQEEVNRSLTTFLSRTSGKHVDYCDFTIDPDDVSISTVREELAKSMKTFYKTTFDKVFVDIHRSPIVKFSVVTFRIDTHAKREGINLKFSDFLFARWSTTKSMIHFIVAPDLDTLRRVSSPKKPLSNTLFSSFPEKVMLGLFPPKLKVEKPAKQTPALTDVVSGTEASAAAALPVNVDDKVMEVSPCDNNPWSALTQEQKDKIADEVFA